MSKVLSIIVVVVVAFILIACGPTPPVVDDTTPPADEVTEHVHIYSEVIVASTCTSEGSVKLVCECGDVQSENVLGVVDHTPSVVDCEKDTVCVVCNEVLTTATGHIFGDKEIVSEATCFAAGKEKGACLNCGKIVENEIPATGHILAKDGAITVAADGFAITCASCGQSVVLKAQAPVFELTFEEDIETDAKNDIGITVFKPEVWKVSDGVLKVNGNSDIAYLNISDADKLAALGTFLLSFDYMSTAEGAESDAASIVSFLGNFYNGAQTAKGSTAWGWLVKLVEKFDVIATKKEADKINDTTSIAIERNKNYKIQAVIVPTARVAHMFVDGTYIGICSEIPTLSIMGQENLTIRFGDGPKCGQIFDNFVIADLK